MQKLQEYLDAHPNKTQLIFDFDDTILKLHLDWNDFETQVKDFLKEYDSEFFELHQDEHIQELVNSFIAEYGTPVRANFDCIQRSFETENLDKITPNKELVKFIRDQNHNYEMYLWTNNNSYTVDNALSLLDIFDCFMSIVTRDLVELGKPAAQGLYTLFGPVLSADQRNRMVYIADDQLSQRAAAEANIDYFQVAPYPWE